jgi:hypothetical protein
VTIVETFMHTNKPLYKKEDANDIFIELVNKKQRLVEGLVVTDLITQDIEKVVFLKDKYYTPLDKTEREDDPVRKTLEKYAGKPIKTRIKKK